MKSIIFCLLVTFACLQTEAANHPPTLPGAPTVSAGTVTASGATVSWGASTDADGNTITYELQYSIYNTPSDPWHSAGTTTSLTRSISGLAASTTYNVRVQASDGLGGLSSWSLAAPAFTTQPGSTSGSIVAGFDREFFPAPADMADLIHRTNLRWCGYYLDAPSQRLDTGWLGERSYLVDTLGWKIAPLYVGQQDPSLGGNLSFNPSSQQGIIDGNEAVAEMGSDTGATQKVFAKDPTTGKFTVPEFVPQGQGFSPGTIVYLDWENAPITVGNNTDYIVAWCQTVAASNYKPGVYCPSSDIAVIAPLVTAYNVQFWAATWPGRTPNPDGSVGPIVSSTTTQFLTTDPATGHASATSLQYGAGYSIQTVLGVDLDTSSLYGGSSPPLPTVSIVSASPNPSSVVAGNTFTINAVVTSSQSQPVLLGASLLPAGTTSGYISDPPHDASWTLISGNNNVSRQFTVPSGTTAGTYDLLFTVRQDSNGNGQIDSGDKVLAPITIPNALAVTTLPNPPSAPTATAATSVTSSGFVANWNSSIGATGYRMDVSTSSTFSSYISGGQDVELGNNLAAYFPGLSANTTYYYRVRAYSGSGTSGNSGTIAVTTLPNPPPAPTANAASSVTSSGFTANWSSASGATGYRLDISTSSTFSSFFSFYQDLDILNFLNRTVGGLSANTTYYYRVRAYNAGGTSGNSSTINMTTLPNPPSAPTTTMATSVSSSGFTANWSSASGATGYRLDISTSSTFSSYVSGYQDLDILNLLNRTVSGLSAGTTYYYRVRAYNTGGTGGNSGIITVATTGGGASSPIISNPHRTGATFTLSVPTQVGFNYTLEYKNALSDANWTVVQTLAGTAGTITLTDNGATGSSRLYHVRVQ